LQKHLDKLPVGFPPTKSGVEIDILKILFSKIEAKIALCLSLNDSSIKKIQKRMEKKFGKKMTFNKLEKMLDKLFMEGSINRNVKKNKKYYSNAMLVIGMFEFHVDNLSKTFVEKMHQYLDEGFKDEYFKSELPQLRTSPHIDAVAEQHKIETYDNMIKYVKNTNKNIYVANCVCKQGAELLGEPCKRVDNIEVCLMFNQNNYVERNQARKITKKKCLKILDYAEESGLVIQPGNTREPFCICLCCGCCCEVLTTAKKYKKPAELFSTNYYASLDKSKCTGCRLCVDRCQIDAITVKSKKAEINHDRCIGCGLCVTKCPQNAIKLIKKDDITVPPKNIISLYLKILKNKVGKKKMILKMLKMLFGKQL